MWARLVRDSVAEALPLSQVGGYVAGARALSLTGVGWSVAAASTIVDVTLEFLAQLAYTALGLALFVWLQPDTRLAPRCWSGCWWPLPPRPRLSPCSVAASGTSTASRGIFGGGWAERGGAGAAALHAAADRDLSPPQRVVVFSFALHFGCWIASAVQLWLLLWLAGAPLPFTARSGDREPGLRDPHRRVCGAAGDRVAGRRVYRAWRRLRSLARNGAGSLAVEARRAIWRSGLPVVAIWQTIEARRLLHRRSVAPSA